MRNLKEDMNIKNKLVKNTTFNSLNVFISMAIGFFLLPIILQIIGKELYGIYILIITLSGYINIMETGVGTASVKFISQHLIKNEKKEINEILTNSLIFYFLVGVITATVLVLISLFFVNFFNIPPRYLSLTKQTLIFAGIALLIIWPLRLFRKVLEGNQDYTVTSGATIAFEILNFLLIILFLRKCSNPFLFFVILKFISQIFLNLFFCVYSFRRLDFLKVDYYLISKKAFKKIFKFSSILYLCKIIGLLIFNTDKILISVFLNISSITLYEITYKFLQLVKNVSNLSSSAILPLVSSLNSKNDNNKIKEIFLRVSKYTIVLVLPITISIIIFAKYIVLYWLGPEYNSIVFPIQLFVSYSIYNCSLALVGQILVAIDKVRYTLYYRIGIAVSNLILSIILIILTKNFIGVIWGTVISYCIGYPIYLSIALKLIKVDFYEFLNKVILPTYPYAIFPVIIGILICQLVPPKNLIYTLIDMGGVVFLYFNCVFFMGLKSYERRDIKEIALKLIGVN